MKQTSVTLRGGVAAMLSVAMRLVAMLSVALMLLTAAHLGAQQVHNAKYPKDPAFAPLQKGDMGETITFTMENSKIYAGTSREITVYVPKEYTGKEPACLLVCLDGVLFNAITVMQNLIRSGEMPVTIGLFVQPGIIYARSGEAGSSSKAGSGSKVGSGSKAGSGIKAGSGAGESSSGAQKRVQRYNRSNEFDRVDGTFARFLEEEVLPLVATLKCSGGQPILISSNPNNRAITGASSGAICAFSAAWFRPDLFRRVYSSVGTFVAMRGGNQYPWIIRKTEPKPLRIYLQDGVNDAWNPLFGEWWEANQLMESALDFAGYELFFKWDRGGHSIKHGTALFPDAMRWLWRGWPAAVECGSSRNDMLQALLPEQQAAQRSQPWQRCSLTAEERVLFEEACKSPMEAISPGGWSKAVAQKGSMWIYSYTANNPGSPDTEWENGLEFYYLHSAPNQIAFDTEGDLYVASEIGIQVCDHNGRVRAILNGPKGSVERMLFIGNRLIVESGGELFCRVLRAKGSRNPFEEQLPKSQGQG
ncbi:MAG: alpha/beta hydrolase-fold protein [bacterium]|nr:alpha/beta hydrolase-fold protein [bacterium]